jgi:hypothetical protein
MVPCERSEKRGRRRRRGGGVLDLIQGSQGGVGGTVAWISFHFHNGDLILRLILRSQHNKESWDCFLDRLRSGGLSAGDDCLGELIKEVSWGVVKKIFPATCWCWEKILTRSKSSMSKERSVGSWDRDSRGLCGCRGSILILWDRCSITILWQSNNWDLRSMTS